MYRLIVILLLSGCGVKQEPFDWTKAGTWSGEAKESNENFIVNYPSTIKGPILGTVEQVWLDAQECVGIPTRAGLTIEYTSKSEIQAGYNGYILYHLKYIRVSDQDYNNQTLAHEFVHWILFVNGVSHDQNNNHKSPFFNDCANQS